MQLERVVICVKCGNKTPFDRVKADINGKDWICSRCYELQHAKKSKYSANISAHDLKRAIKPVLQTKENVQKRIEVKCEKCGYSYYTTNIPRLCSFCGRAGTVKTTVSASASEILRDVEEEYKKVKDKFIL